MNNNKDLVIIIGAGPAGLAAAYELNKRNQPFLIIEKENNTVGGIARTVQYKKYRFDIGGHRFFTKVDRVMNFWKTILGDDFLVCNRLSRIYFDKQFFYYPIKPFDVLQKLGILRSLRAIISFAVAQIFKNKKEESFRDYIVNHFGEYLYEIFFKTYTEKVWGIPCEQIRADWAAQRIKGVSFISILKTSLLGNHNNIKSLIEEFYYPKYGPGMMWNKTLELALQNGNSGIRFQTSPVNIFTKNRSVQSIEIKNSDGKNEIIACKAIVSSMPISELVGIISPKLSTITQNNAKLLTYRDFILVALIINQDKIFPDNWIYIHEPEVYVGRIQNFKNWSSHMVEDDTSTCLGMEYFVSKGDKLWSMSDKELISLASNELVRLGFTDANRIIDGSVVRMEKTYPVYDKNYPSAIETIKNDISAIKNLYTVGRNGMHRYNNQDHSMLTAMLAVDNIFGANHNLWEVNVERTYLETKQDSI